MSRQSPSLNIGRRRSLRLNSPSEKGISITLENKENYCSPDLQANLDLKIRRTATTAKTPLTPVQNNLVHNLRQRLEQQLSEKMERSAPMSETRTSPGLTKLRMTPGRKLREKQEVLLQKHEEARSKAVKSGVGGGISIWPEMDNMRLSAKDAYYLALSSVSLTVCAVYAFYILHGPVIGDMKTYLHQLDAFSEIHPLDTSSTQQSFNSSLLLWHTAFTSLLDEVSSRLEVSISYASVSYQLYVLLYIVGIVTLLYYLADNVLSTNRLTPRRIKIWVSLLAVMGTWTFLMLHMLVLAQAVEASIETNVHWLNSQLADLVYMQFDLMAYRDVRAYWQTRCLPPTTRGTLTLLGLVAIRDVSYYLQYYSLPILTALFMPVGKLLLALKQVYTVKPHS